MASAYGYNTPGDMRVFYTADALQTRPRLREQKDEGTVMDFLYANPETSIFAYLVEKANLVWLLGGSMFDSTVFVPLNSALMARYSEDVIKNIGEEMAYRIVRYSILKNRIEYWLLETMNYAALVPDKSYDRIEMFNVDGNLILNETVRVLKMDKVCTNGVVLFVDDILNPYNYS